MSSRKCHVKQSFNQGLVFGVLREKTRVLRKNRQITYYKALLKHPPKCLVTKGTTMFNGSDKTLEGECLIGETVETVSDFFFLGSKITADGDCSHEIKRCLLLGRKVITNLDSMFKSRDITLPTKVRLVKAMVFPIVMLWM